MDHNETDGPNSNMLHYFGKLYQQYIVDQFCKIELMRLRFIKSNQQKLRADLYQGVMDSIQRGDVEQSGRAIILPSSFTNSDRFMHQQYHNAMALVHEFGKPTFFLTVTCNVNWPKIQTQLKPGQTPCNRPDITCRVFKQKLDQIIKDIECGLFGKVKCRVRVIEYQKRGAPHAHILIWIENFEMTPRNIDDVISAEIPKEGDPLQEIVIQTMVHGPCGSLNPTLGCMQKGRCKQNYPRDFCDHTEITDDAFPKYRRRSPQHGGQIAHKYFRGTRLQIDNGNIVPYFPYILRKYGCHNNAEFCASIESMKYLFKYHFKGPDMVTVENGETIIDEVQSYETK